MHLKICATECTEMYAPYPTDAVSVNFQRGFLSEWAKFQRGTSLAFSSRNFSATLSNRPRHNQLGENLCLPRCKTPRHFGDQRYCVRDNLTASVKRIFPIMTIFWRLIQSYSLRHRNTVRTETHTHTLIHTHTHTHTLTHTHTEKCSQTEPR